MRNWKIVLPLVAIVAIGVGYVALNFRHRTEPQVDLALEYRPKAAEYRDRLKRIGSKLEVGRVHPKERIDPLSPKPVYDGDSFNSKPSVDTNTIMITLEQCTEMKRVPKQRQFAIFGIRESVEGSFFSLMEGNRFSAPMLIRESEAPARREWIEKGLPKIKYVGITGTLRYDPAVLGKDHLFSGGKVELDVWLVDYETEIVVCEFARSFDVGKTLQVKYSRPKDQTNYSPPSVSEVENYAHGKLSTQAHNEICKTLADLTGGTFASH